MTAAQRATLEIVRASALEDDPAQIVVSYGYEHAGAVADALRAALGTCGTCQHADDSQAAVGWTWCAAEGGFPAFPFKHESMPLGERCTGYTPKEGA